MFARSVSLRLKTNLLAELTRTIEDEMVPLLRKRTGFRGRITLGVPGGAEAVAISLWAKKWYAKAYNGEPLHNAETLNSSRALLQSRPTKSSTRHSAR